MKIDLEKIRLKAGKKVHLDEVDPGDTSAFRGTKADGANVLAKLNDELSELQERLYAEHKHPILIILQGMDTCGKDGTIEHVFEGVNPQGVRVANFKVPTPLEQDHDFLWRIHQQTPARGEMVIFNRSQYEDVLVVRVHQLVPEKVWRRRYAHINAFERELADEGATILKFFLHISKEEQKQRLLARLDQPDKLWKFNPGDLKERDLWDRYMKAYEDVLDETSTDWAPWHLVPADHKWFRNLVVASTLVKTLKDLDPQPPTAPSEKEIAGWRATLLEG